MLCLFAMAIDDDDFGKEVIMSVYALKIKVDGNVSKAISILRKFDQSLSISEIRKRMQCNDFGVEYDLLHWDITEEMAGIDRITKFEKFIQSLEECGARVEIYKGNELVSKEFFGNSMQMLREIADEVEEDMDREAEDS